MYKLTLLIFTGYAAAQTLTTIATFTSAPADGIGPSGVAIGSSGVLYGTTGIGGSTNYGTVFSIAPPTSPGGSWTEAVLYNFTGGSDGGYPMGLAIGGGGVLYGATTSGGTGTCAGGCGTVFALTPPASPGAAWTESVPYSFQGGNDGIAPTSGVVISSGGVIYGTTSTGGTGNSGTVFSLIPPKGGGAWAEAVLYSFTADPNPLVPSGVVIGPGGVLYGATRQGGISTGSTCFPLGCGTAFSLTPPKAGSAGAWTEALLYSFTGGDDGYQPSGVAIGAGSVLYVTAESGGHVFGGTVIALTPPVSPSSIGNWNATVLYNFGGSAEDVSAPSSGVVIRGGGVLYGTACAEAPRGWAASSL
jgi:uncharacterized repeat protein (TIGR03803 family)